MVRDLSRAGHAGFSIVEVLVALVVLAVGMLGIASLYVTSLRAGSSALLRTQAVNLVADMADRIRANPTAGEAYAGAASNYASAASPYAGDASDYECAAGKQDCSDAQRAAGDLVQWHGQVVRAMPAPLAGTPPWTISVTPGDSPRSYTITINWLEPGEQGNLTYSLTIQV